MTFTTSKRSRTPAHIQRLVEQVAEAAAEPRYARLKEMWTRHHRMEKVSKPPVYVGLFVNPEFYTVVWQELIPPDTIISEDPLERDVEIQLRQRLYKHEHVPDDDVLLPTVWVKAVPSTGKTEQSPPSTPHGEHSEGEVAARLWGLPFMLRKTDSPGGAYIVEPVVKSEEDMALLRRPTYEIDEEATKRRVERATELVAGLLDVRVATDQVGFCTSEVVVSLMGIEAIMYGVIDNPDFIHRMMDMVTDGTIKYHQEREAAGAVEVEASWSYRAHYEELPPDANRHSLSNSWLTFSAQSLCGISPAMYSEFLQPYHARLATAFGDARVYLHACENMTRKLSIIKELPNLRRVHISAWTDLKAAVEELGNMVVLETDVHTGETIFVYTHAQMRESMERILETAGHCFMDVNLTALETVNGDPSILTRWAQIAQEVTAAYS